MARTKKSDTAVVEKKRPTAEDLKEIYGLYKNIPTIEKIKIVSTNVYLDDILAEIKKRNK